MMLYIVICNDKIDRVFTTRASAAKYIKDTGGCNLWEIVEKRLE
jgi:hypothetical protein